MAKTTDGTKQRSSSSSLKKNNRGKENETPNASNDSTADDVTTPKRPRASAPRRSAKRDSPASHNSPEVTIIDSDDDEDAPAIPVLQPELSLTSDSTLEQQKEVDQSRSRQNSESNQTMTTDAELATAFHKELDKMSYITKELGTLHTDFRLLSSQLLEPARQEAYSGILKENSQRLRECKEAMTLLAEKSDGLEHVTKELDEFFDDVKSLSGDMENVTTSNEEITQAIHDIQRSVDKRLHEFSKRIEELKNAITVVQLGQGNIREEFSSLRGYIEGMARGTVDFSSHRMMREAPTSAQPAPVTKDDPLVTLQPTPSSSVTLQKSGGFQGFGYTTVPNASAHTKKVNTVPAKPRHKKECVLCDGKDHFTNNCTKYVDGTDRAARVKQLSICYQCAKPYKHDGSYKHVGCKWPDAKCKYCTKANQHLGADGRSFSNHHGSFCSYKPLKRTHESDDSDDERPKTAKQGKPNGQRGSQ